MPKPKYRSPFESFVMIDAATDIKFTPDMRQVMSGPWRVWTVALNRLNNYGHAPFRQGELPMIVCGDDSQSSRANVREWLRKLSAIGWIAPSARTLKPGEIGSTPLCIVVSNSIAVRGAGKASDFVCSEPSHFDCKKQSWPSVTDVSDWDEPDADADDDDDAWTTPKAASADTGPRNRYDRSWFE